MANVHPFPRHADIEEQAGDWLARLDGDTPLSQQELADLRAWIHRSPVHRKELHRIAHFWQQANVLTELSFPLARPHQQHPYKPAPEQRRFSRRLALWLSWRSAGAVATVLVISLVIGLSAWYADKRGFTHPGIAGNGIYETRIGEQNSITLADGSVIQLNTNSRVQVNYTNSQRGIVLMEGEAHFDVSKDIQRPFEVTAGRGRVRAVGTAFTVRYRPQVVDGALQARTDALQVTVTEGKVALEALEASDTRTKPGADAPTASANSAKPEVSIPIPRGALTAGQSVLFQPQAPEPIEASIQTLGEDALYQALAWRDGLLLFSGEPLREVVKEISRYTRSHIEIVDPEIAELSIGGQFKVGETQAMLHALAVSFDLEVRQVSADHIQLAKKP